MKILTIELQYLMPSLNRQLRQHWRQRRKIKLDLLWLLAIEGFDLRLDKERRANRYQMRYVTITRYAVQLMDQDNLVGAMKPLIDALCDFDIIYDDDCVHLGLTCLQVRVPHKVDQKITIRVAEAE